MRLSRCFTIFFAILLMAVPVLSTAAAPQSQSIEAIRTGLGAGGTRVTVDLGMKSDFRAFHLANPYRIVLDLPSSKWVAAKSGLMSGGLIRAYRSGVLEGGITRVIFDLGRAATISNAVFLPKSSFEKNRVVIDLIPATANMFNARLPQVYGSREIRTPAPTPSQVSSQSSRPTSSYAREQNRIVRDAQLPIEDADVTGEITGTVKQREPLSSSRAPENRTAAPMSRKQTRKYVVVIDAGHGGEDPGALGRNGVVEKRITLTIAKELERQLSETGRYRAVLTRSTDKYIKLRERVAIAKRAKADLFISIHADKIGRTNVRGASIYTLSQNASDNETARLADQENNSGVVAGVDLANESQDVADILLDLAMREKMNESKLLAKYLDQAFRDKSIRLLPNSHRAAGFAVLKAPDVPAALIETGFLSNPEEAKLLSTSAFQRRIASAMVDGIDAYFRKIQALQKF